MHVLGLILLQAFISTIEQYYVCQCQLDLSWYILHEQGSIDQNLNLEQLRTSAIFSYLKRNETIYRNYLQVKM